MKETYFVIRNSDGDTTVHEYDREHLLHDIQAGEYGKVLAELPEDSDTNYWGNGVLIIKGKVVQPKAEQVVTKYNIE